MPPSWTLADLTELDFRLARGVPGDVAAGGHGTSPRTALRAWLSAQRDADPGPWRAARAMARSELLLRWILRAFSLGSGAAAAAGLLRYDGTAPINVAFFLGILVGGQLLILAFFLMARLLRRLGLGRGGQAWMVGLFLHVQRRFLSRDVPDLSSPLPSSGGPWSLRAFASLQSAGVFFNLGVLAATLALVGFQDLGFGWATTLEVPPERIHHVVSLLSAPWGGTWSPDLAQIAASRIRLGQAQPGHYDPKALASWWPFLVGCVLCYGVLPRLLLTFGAESLLAWRLRGEAPRGPAAQRLLLLLTRTPLSVSAGEGDAPLPLPRTEGIQDPAVQAQGPLRLVIPPELDEAAARAALAALAAKRFQVAVETEGDPVPPGGMLLLREAWRPPLEEDLAALRAWREKAGSAKDLFVWCVGFPHGQATGRFDPPDAMDLGVWRESLARLRDPRLWLVPWEESI